MKRKITPILCGVVAIALLTGCGSGPTGPSTSASGGEQTTSTQAQQIELQFWNPFTGDDGRYMTQIVDAFNTEKAGSIHVTTQTMATDDYYTKLPVVVAAGTGIPDVVVVDVDRLPYFSQKGLIQPIDDLIASSGLSKADFAPTAWDAGTQVDGKRYSIPLDTLVFLMFYNKTMLHDLGYTEADLTNLTSDKFIEMCKKATTGDNYGVGVNWPGMSIAWYSMLGQMGGSLVDPANPGKAAFNTPAGAAAAKWFKDLLDQGLTNKPGSDHIPLFKQGKSLFAMDGIWSSTGMNDVAGLDWGEMFLPIAGQSGKVWATSHNLALMTQPNEDESRRQAAMTFIKYVSDNSSTWAAGGEIPVRLSVLQDPTFTALPWSFAATQLDWFFFLPAATTAGNFIDAMNAPLVDYFNGNTKTPEEAMDAAAKSGEATAAQTLAGLGG